jgi:riboflavin kinase/FMN adenylyltransferase
LAKDFAGAQHLLGRPFFVMGRVERGRQVGRLLGFPTVNLSPPPEKLLPANGVYRTLTRVGGQYFHSLTNIGHSPTFQNVGHKVESHLLNFSREVYGEEVAIFFYQWLRDETRFASPEALAAQLRQDLQTVTQATAAPPTAEGVPLGCVSLKKQPDF